MSEENKNNPLQGNETESESAAESHGRAGDESGYLKKQEAELEKLAELFQDEYDKTKNDVESQEPPVSAEPESQDIPQQETSANDITSHEYHYSEGDDIPEDEVCVFCGVNRRDTSEFEDSEYCSKCQAYLARPPLPIKNYIALFAVCLTVLLALVQIVINFPATVKLSHADSLDRKNQSASALSAYAAQLQEYNTASVTSNRAIRKTIELLYATGQANYVPTYYEMLSGTAAKLPFYRYLGEYNERSGAIVAGLQDAYALISDYTTNPGDNIPYDMLIGELDALIQTYTEDVPYYEYKQATAYYYKYYVAYIAEKEPNAYIAFLEEIEHLVPEDTWLYAYPLSHAHARLGNTERALEVVERMQKVNSEDASSYAVQAAAYRVARDYDKAMEACDNGMQASVQTSVEIIRQKAIILLLQGKPEEAVDELAEVFDSIQSLEAFDTLAICALAAGNTEIYDKIVAIYNQNEENPLSFSAPVEDFKNGTKTAEQIFLEGYADVYQ